MNNELVLYSRGELSVPFHDRKISRRAKPIYDETRLVAMKADAAMALGGHIMEGALRLDQHRKSLSQGDPAVDMMLCEIEATTLQQVKKVQSSLFNNWGF